MSEMNFVFHSVNGKRMAKERQIFLEQQKNGKRTAKEWQKNGKRTAKERQNNGKKTAK